MRKSLKEITRTLNLLEDLIAKKSYSYEDAYLINKIDLRCKINNWSNKSCVRCPLNEEIPSTVFGFKTINVCHPIDCWEIGLYINNPSSFTKEIRKCLKGTLKKTIKFLNKNGYEYK